MIAFDDIVFKITGQGADDRKLGQWKWVIITGKPNVKSIVVTCYCSCKVTSPGYVYSQHLVYMAENSGEIPNKILCPCQLFAHNLKSFIEEKSEEVHQLIVCGDFNSEYEDLVE